MPQNVFVLGMDEHNRETLQSLPHLKDYVFHSLLTLEALQQGDDIDLPGLLDDAERQLDAFDGSVDAILGYWDFPVSSMVPILCQRRGLASASLESVVKCENKYWSRLEQRKVIDALPGFAEVGFDATEKPDSLDYPLWLKPVKAFSSELAFRVTDDDGFRDALAQIEEGAGRVGEAFQFVMDEVPLPPEVEKAGGTACLAEEEGQGDQITVEGYVYDGEVRIYGVVDSLCYPDTASFLRYQYPSRLPEAVTDKLATLSTRVIGQLGLNWATFNIEYFVDAANGTITLLEVNPRHSQSHAQMFEFVDGIPNHECIVRLALGREPELTSGKGEFAVAAKWFLRRFSDGHVRRVPTPEEVQRLEDSMPGTTLKIIAKEGERLSELPSQDSYSYEIAQVFVGADDEAGLEEKYRACVDALNFEIDDIDGDTAATS